MKGRAALFAVLTLTACSPTAEPEPVYLGLEGLVAVQAEISGFRVGFGRAGSEGEDGEQRRPGFHASSTR